MPTALRAVPAKMLRHNCAYVRFRGLIVIKMTLCVMMNRTTVANREKPAVLSVVDGDHGEGLFGRACRRLPTARTCPAHIVGTS